MSKETSGLYGKYVCLDCDHRMIFPKRLLAPGERRHCPKCGSSFIDPDVKIKPNKNKRPRTLGQPPKRKYI